MVDLHGYIERSQGNAVLRALSRSPAVAILGPRQCGKSTLARHLLAGIGEDAHVYLDLQDRQDRRKLDEPELFFEAHRHELVCLDEIQETPELFSYLRSEIDRDRRPGRFLVLGSASRDLVQSSSETLAGRVAFIDLTPFRLREVAGVTGWRDLWLRGGFPESLLAGDLGSSIAWRNDFIRTFLTRDIPSFEPRALAPEMERLWRLLAHFHGQTLNTSKIAAAADLPVAKLKRYLDTLEQTYMIRTLPPYHSNLKKRTIKAPKLYLRDSGILHSLLDVDTFDDLLAHPQNGASYEGFAIEQLLARFGRHRPCFVRTSNGAEIDLVLERGQELLVFEFKMSKAPKPSRGFHTLLETLKPEGAWLVAPVDEPFAYNDRVTVAPVWAAGDTGR